MQVFKKFLPRTHTDWLTELLAESYLFRCRSCPCAPGTLSFSVLLIPQDQRVVALCQRKALCTVVPPGAEDHGPKPRILQVATLCETVEEATVVSQRVLQV